MFKKLVLTILLALPLVYAPVVQAHILKTDGSIGAVMHINPEDDPIITQPSDFFFEIKDTENKFDLSKCHCEGLVIKNDKVLYSTSLSKHDGEVGVTSAGFTYTFPEKGVYTIMLNGMPLETVSFKTFSLKYSVRVEREPLTQPHATSQSASNPLLPLVLVPIAVLIILGIIKLATHGSKKGKKPLAIILIPLIIALHSMSMSHLNVVYADLAVPHHTPQMHELHDHPCCLPLVALSSIHIHINPPRLGTELQQKIQLSLKQQEAPTLLRNRSPPYSYLI